MELTEYIIWGKAPNQKDEEVLYTLSKTKVEAEKVISILKNKYGCSHLRLQVLNLSEPPNFADSALINI